MFSFLSKFLPLLVYPLGLAFILLVVALFLQGKRKWQNTALVLALIILYLGSNRWVSSSLARSLEWRNLPPIDLTPAEVIVVLGGGTEPALYPRLMAEVNSAGDRVLYAARLFQDGKAPHLLLSGGYIPVLETRPSSPAQEMAQILELTGVPPEAIWLEEKSTNTYENALYSSQILKEKGISRIILVTSAMHMPRSIALFEHQGMEVIPAPVDFTITESEWNALFSPNLQTLLINLLPNPSSLGLTTNVLKEYFGMEVYRLRGWL
jgi:uncharacterized SAM-binding protein YcdF (DUF218 family)